MPRLPRLTLPITVAAGAVGAIVAFGWRAGCWWTAHEAADSAWKAAAIERIEHDDKQIDLLWHRPTQKP